jgi:hypothetical protein
MKTNMKSIRSLCKGLLLILCLVPSQVWAAEAGPQKIVLTLTKTDDGRSCKALVLSADSKPVKDVSVNFYIKRNVGLLPIGTLKNTNEEGEAIVNFPKTIPGDANGNVVVIARLDDDETITDQKSVAWGTKLVYKESVEQKALWASNAPTYLIILSNAIIAGIWGTMGYILFLLFFRVKKSGANYNP